MQSRGLYIEDCFEGEETPGCLQYLLSLTGDGCLRTEGIYASLGYQVGLLLTDDAGIADINRLQRGVDRPTDVLSFPSVHYPSGTARGNNKRLRREIDPETGRAYLGDIVISLPRARAQAKSYGHSFLREMAFLFAHGMLHLLGYDHETQVQRAAMRQMEDKIMEETGINRELTDADFELLRDAREVMRRAYTPYSNYKVGACVRTADGRTFSGCNVENASFGLTICAERNAITTAVAQGATALEAIAIAAEEAMPYPCGACRQFMREFAGDMKIIVANREGIRTTSLSALLPDSFGPESLNGVNE